VLLVQPHNVVYSYPVIVALGSTCSDMRIRILQINHTNTIMHNVTAEASTNTLESCKHHPILQMSELVICSQIGILVNLRISTAACIMHGHSQPFMITRANIALYNALTDKLSVN